MVGRRHGMHTSKRLLGMAHPHRDMPPVENVNHVSTCRAADQLRQCDSPSLITVSGRPPVQPWSVSAARTCVSGRSAPSGASANRRDRRPGASTLPTVTSTSPRTVTLDGYAASHRAVREMKADGELPADTKLRSSKYLNNLIEQDHRGVKLRIGPMLGFKRFRTAAIAIAGIELLLRIRKGQCNLSQLHLQDRRAPVVWGAVLAAL